jgi:hypothetical protein
MNGDQVSFCKTVDTITRFSSRKTKKNHEKGSQTATVDIPTGNRPKINPVF